MDIKGTAGNDDLKGTGHADVFHMEKGGTDTVSGGGGNDVFLFGNSLNADDHINGGTGDDTLQLSHGGNVLIGAHALISVENILLIDNGSYTITFLGAGQIGDHVIMDGSALSSNHTMTVDAGNEKTRTVELLGGDGIDHLTGGQKDDQLSGGLGLDYLDGEKGHDTLLYSAVAELTGVHCDHVTFDVHNDAFGILGVTGVDHVLHKRLDGTGPTGFDSHLENKVDASALAAHHAVVLVVTLGDWSGHTFLIVDANGVAGYQGGGKDYVFDMLGDHLQQIDMSNFAV